jgi:hypothetical protein
MGRKDSNNFLNIGAEFVHLQRMNTIARFSPAKVSSEQAMTELERLVSRRTAVQEQVRRLQVQLAEIERAMVAVRAAISSTGSVTSTLRRFNQRPVRSGGFLDASVPTLPSMTRKA